MKVDSASDKQYHGWTQPITPACLALRTRKARALIDQKIGLNYKKNKPEINRTLLCRSFTRPILASIISLTNVVLVMPGAADAADFAIQPRLNTGVMYYDFEQQGLFNLMGSTVGTGFSKISFSDTIPMIGGGATFFYDRFFLDIYAQGAFDGEDEDTLEQAGRGNQGLFTSNRINRDWDREEYSISVGYAVTDNFALFAGYRFSDTEFDEKNDLNVLNIATSTFDSTLDYEQDGPFIGGNYGWQIGDAGVLAINFGIAFIEGEITQKVNEIRGEFTGDTVGTTAGLSWSAPFFGNFNYVLAIDGYQYSFDADDELTPDFSETVVRATAGVSYIFD